MLLKLSCQITADESPQAQEIQEAKRSSAKDENKKKQMHLQHNIVQFNQKHQIT